LQIKDVQGVETMHRLIGTAVVFGLLAIPTASAGGLVEGAELEHARANARAGGPVSERDAELLERYGCLSGTRNRFCEDLRHRGNPARVQRRYHTDRDWDD
jgi:hypothetical protein